MQGYPGFCDPGLQPTTCRGLHGGSSGPRGGGAARPAASHPPITRPWSAACALAPAGATVSSCTRSSLSRTAAYAKNCHRRPSRIPYSQSPPLPSPPLPPPPAGSPASGTSHLSLGRDVRILRPTRNSDTPSWGAAPPLLFPPPSPSPFRPPSKAGAAWTAGPCDHRLTLWDGELRDPGRMLGEDLETWTRCHPIMSSTGSCWRPGIWHVEGRRGKSGRVGSSAHTHTRARARAQSAGGLRLVGFYRTTTGTSTGSYTSKRRPPPPAFDTHVGTCTVLSIWFVMT